MRKRDRLMFGVVLPIAAMCVALLVIMQTETGAGAAEFAALGIFLWATIALPLVVIINLVLAFQPVDTPKKCFMRGLFAPGMIVAGAIVYQTGLWDALT